MMDCQGQRPFQFWKTKMSWAFFRKHPEMLTPSIKVILEQMQGWAKYAQAPSQSSSAQASTDSPRAEASAGTDAVTPAAEGSTAQADSSDEEWAEDDWMAWRAFKKLRAEGNPTTFVAMTEEAKKMKQQVESFHAQWRNTASKLQAEEQAHAAFSELVAQDKFQMEQQWKAKEQQWLGKEQQLVQEKQAIFFMDP
jgi:hypothetical protein